MGINITLNGADGLYLLRLPVTLSSCENGAATIFLVLDYSSGCFLNECKGGEHRCDKVRSHVDADDVLLRSPVFSETFHQPFATNTHMYMMLVVLAVGVVKAWKYTVT
ncbi:hypothetical protein AMECASPLE_000120 [Ameca splendens]|uniref:Uncharacterized protein n=1 Tax=Ameca splendens TaxID=208324 RepID=A0ABV0YVS9_9TELE